MTDALFTLTTTAGEIQPGTYIAGRHCRQCDRPTTWVCTDNRPGKPPYTEGKRLLHFDQSTNGTPCRTCCASRGGPYDPEQEFPLP